MSDYKQGDTVSIIKADENIKGMTGLDVGEIGVICRDPKADCEYLNVTFKAIQGRFMNITVRLRPENIIKINQSTI